MRGAAVSTSSASIGGGRRRLWTYFVAERGHPCLRRVYAQCRGPGQLTPSNHAASLSITRHSDLPWRRMEWTAVDGHRAVNNWPQKDDPSHAPVSFGGVVELLSVR